MNEYLNTEATDTMTVDKYIRGIVGCYPLTDEAVGVIALQAQYDLDEDVTEISKAGRDWIEIYTLKHILNEPAMTGSVADANGSWSHKQGAVEISAADKAQIRKRLGELETLYGIANNRGIRIHNQGMKIW